MLYIYRCKLTESHPVSQVLSASIKVVYDIEKVMHLTIIPRARMRSESIYTYLVTTYNPHTMFIAIVEDKHWHFLQSKERLAHIFREGPLLVYRRPKSLRNTLVSTTLKTKTPDNYSSTRGGCGPCNKPRCRLCIHINKASTFTGIKNCKG